MAVLAAAVLGVLGACSGDDSSPEASPATTETTETTETTGAVDAGAGTGHSTAASPAAPVLDSSSVLSIDSLAPAVTALEAELGGPQRYTEINVQTGLVNLFVALDDGTELAYVFRDGDLEAPAGAQPQLDGAVAFDLSDIPLDVAATFPEQLAAELPETRLVGLSLADHGDAGVGWLASLLSDQGGVLDVLISPSGAVVGAAPR